MNRCCLMIVTLMLAVVCSEANGQIYFDKWTKEVRFLEVYRSGAESEVSTLRDMDHYQRFFEARRVAHVMKSRYDLVNDKGLREFLELTKSQCVDLIQAREDFERENRENTTNFQNEHELIIELHGENSDHLNKLVDRRSDQYKQTYKKYEESLDQLLLPYQQELLVQYKSLECMSDRIPEKHAIMRPFLLGKTLGLSEREIGVVQNATFEARQKLDKTIKDNLNAAYKQILVDVPMKKRDAMLSVLTSGRRFARGKTEEDNRAVEEAAKQYRQEYDEKLTLEKVQFFHDKAKQRAFDLSAEQIASLSSSLEKTKANVQEEFSAISAELRIVLEQHGRSHSESKSLIKQNKDVADQAMSELVADLDDVLSETQLEKLMTNCRFSILIGTVRDEQALYWPYMLASTYELDDRQLATIKQRSAEAKARLYKAVAKLKDEAMSKVIDSYPENKRKQLKKLLNMKLDIESENQRESKR